MSLEPVTQNLKFKKLMYHKKVCVFQHGYSCDWRIQMCLDNCSDPGCFWTALVRDADSPKICSPEKVEWIESRV